MPDMPDLGGPVSRKLWAAILIGFSSTFTVGGYEFARSATNTLFKTAFGTENLAVGGAILPIALVAALFLYSKALTLLGTRKTLMGTFILTAFMFLGAHQLIAEGSVWTIGVIYIFRLIYVVVIIEQYWSFLNSILDSATAKKIYGPIAGIASIGPIIAGHLVGQLAEPLGTNAMLLFAAGVLVPAAVLADVAFRLGGEPKSSEEREQESKSKGILADLSLDLFKGSPLLLGMLFLIITTQIYSTALELNFQTILQEMIPEPDKQTAYSGIFFRNLNAASLGFQFVVAPIAMRYVRTSWILYSIPLVHLVAVSLLFGNNTLPYAAGALMLFKALDYSIFRASKETLYIPLSFEVRYRAKQVIDTFGYRVGEGTLSLLVAIVHRTGMFFSGFYLVLGVVSVFAWVGSLIPTLRGYEKAVQETN